MAIANSRKKEFYTLYASGFTIREAAEKVAVSYNTGRAWAKGVRNGSSSDYKKEREAESNGPIAISDLKPEARKCLDDFSRFQRRYFGRIAVPWQEEAAQQIANLLMTPEKEFVIINAPPGSGKSTTFTLDIPAWITAKNRAIRGLMGSATQPQANWYLGRLQRSFETPLPLLGEPDLISKGLALDAVATLSGDYGRFKPEGAKNWSQTGFIVAQPDNRVITEKEMTWQAFGYRGGYIGGRFNILIWDDLVDPKQLRNVDQTLALENDWESIAERRLEPGGILVLQGQRLGSNDLYSYCASKVIPDEIDDELEGYEDRPLDGRKMYTRIVYKAHYDEKCKGKETHKLNSPPYPEGCLLYPRRIPWKEIQTIKANTPGMFEVLYQQEDSDPDGTLVNPLWVSGGRAPTGEIFPGCWDNDRDTWEMPKGLTGNVFYIATADPSPTKFWAVSLWAYHPDTNQRFLLDLIRRKMEAPDFLDYNYNERKFIGIMEEWQERSTQLGMPITTWIVEQNAAQRFLLQYDHTKRWKSKWGVSIIAHDTYRNKADKNYGVQSLAPHWKHGRVRLPGKQFPSYARTTSLKLVEEVTKWPKGMYDDCVMAEWFFEWNLPNLIIQSDNSSRAFRPSWLRGKG